ncbi:MAG: Tim44 domain-containing protein, partial [Rhodospirillales bacterium]|nr:Tim44 domain-containing protein [Rhodospirillales bacterium]
VPEEPLYDPFADEKIAPDAAVREALREIGQKDRAFDPALFLKNAEEAFIMIVEAFADGDKEFLQPLLSEAVYQSFCREIDQRNERGERVVTEINAIRHTEIIGAKLEAKTAYISVSVHAEETCVIKDKNGDVLAGNPNRASEMKDIWVFGRALKSKDPVWQVYETHDDVPEDHKTPIPEAK